MIYSIDAQNPKGEILKMSLKSPEKSGINVIKVTGISPIGADIYSVPFASVDGAIYAGARVPSRPIVLTLGMYEEDLGNGRKSTIEESRLKTYNFFRIKENVRLTFHTDHRDLFIDGYVESNEVDIFSDRETADISVLCVDPWFYATGRSSRNISGITNAFEFPFESVQGSSYWADLIEFGDITVDTRTTLFYEGDIRTGVTMHLSFLGKDFHNIYIYNMDTRERFILYTDQITRIAGDPLAVGDDIVITTVSGKKTVYLLRNGLYNNIISAVDKNSDWLQLTKGNNTFAIASDHGYENIVMTMDFNNAYAGI